MDVNELTEPEHYGVTPPSLQLGLTVDGANRADAKHRCGRCNNGTGVYNPACPNNKGEV